MLGLEEFFLSTCFGHAFWKMCQYATNEKVCKDLWYVFIKTAQGDVQKCIIWPNKSKKGKREWENACVNSSLPPRKMNTLVKTR